MDKCRKAIGIKSDRVDFWVFISTKRPHPTSPPLHRLRKLGMNITKTGEDDGFKVPSAIPQDILLIHNLVGGDLTGASSSSQISTAETNDPSVTHAAKTEKGDADSITSSAGEDSLDEGGDVDMLKTDPPERKEEVDKGADSEEEVEAGLLGGGECGEPMTM